MSVTSSNVRNKHRKTREGRWWNAAPSIWPVHNHKTHFLLPEVVSQWNLPVGLTFPMKSTRLSHYYQNESWRKFQTVSQACLMFDGSNLEKRKQKPDSIHFPWLKETRRARASLCDVIIKLGPRTMTDTCMRTIEYTNIPTGPLRMRSDGCGSGSSGRPVGGRHGSSSQWFHRTRN